MDCCIPKAVLIISSFVSAILAGTLQITELFDLNSPNIPVYITETYKNCSMQNVEILIKNSWVPSRKRVQFYPTATKTASCSHLINQLKCQLHCRFHWSKRLERSRRIINRNALLNQSQTPPQQRLQINIELRKVLCS